MQILSEQTNGGNWLSDRDGQGRLQNCSQVSFCERANSNEITKKSCNRYGIWGIVVVCYKGGIISDEKIQITDCAGWSGCIWHPDVATAPEGKTLR